MKQSGRIKKLLAAGTVLLALGLLVRPGVAFSAAPAAFTASAAQSTQAVQLALSSRQSFDNTPFAVETMFPGDSETGLYRVQISYSGTVTLHFHADIRTGAEKLGRVLQVRVQQGGNTLYESPIADMPSSVDTVLTAAQKTTQELEYTVTAWLDTSVGNEYQTSTLTADLRWWVDAPDSGASSSGSSSGSLQPPPDTGDPSHNAAWGALLAASGASLALLVCRSRKEGAAHE